MIQRLNRAAVRIVSLPAFWMLWGLLLVTSYVNFRLLPVTAQGHAATASDHFSSLRKSNPSPLQREGSVADPWRGKFQFESGRIQFVDASSGLAYTCLENLTLQQATSIATKPQLAGDWIVRGTLTEFDGNNYLLIDRAIRAR